MKWLLPKPRQAKNILFIGTSWALLYLAVGEDARHTIMWAGFGVVLFGLIFSAAINYRSRGREQ